MFITTQDSLETLLGTRVRRVRSETRLGSHPAGLASASRWSHPC